MLDHGNVAIFSLLFNIDLVLLDVGELHLLVLFRLCINSGAGKGGIKRRLARGLVAVTHQLQIKLRRHSGQSGVDNLMFDRHGIGATAKGVGLDEFDAALFR